MYVCVSVCALPEAGRAEGTGCGIHTSALISSSTNHHYGSSGTKGSSNGMHWNNKHKYCGLPFMVYRPQCVVKQVRPKAAFRSTLQHWGYIHQSHNVLSERDRTLAYHATFLQYVVRKDTTFTVNCVRNGRKVKTG